MKGDTITVSDFYDEIKTQPRCSQQVLFQMTINKVFEKNMDQRFLIKKSIKNWLNKKVNNWATNSMHLAQQGLTEETAKKQIRSNMLLNMVNQAAKKDIKESDYKALFESYTPEVTAKIIKLDSEDKAKEVLEAAKAEGADFAQIAKRQSNRYCYKDKVAKSSSIQEQQISHLKSKKQPLSWMKWDFRCDHSFSRSKLFC